MERFRCPRTVSAHEIEGRGVDKSSGAHLKAHQTPSPSPLASQLIDTRLITEIRRRERRFSRMFMADP